MTSNSLYTNILKHVFLFFAIMAGFIGLDGFFGGNSITVNGVKRAFDIYDLFIALLFSLIFFCLWLLLRKSVVRVKLGGQNITILKKGEEESINWHDVDSITHIPFIHPPLYKLKIKERDNYYLFITGPWSLTIGLWTFDLSEMGSFLKRKKRELGL